MTSRLENNHPAPFIVGTGRCGTTLLRMMLDAHPLLAIPPETHFIHAVTVTCHGEADIRNQFFEAIVSSQKWKKFQLDAAVLRSRLQEIEPFDCGEGLRTFYRLYAERFGKPRWGDKTPAYHSRMRQVQQLLPEAHFVHLIRDGRDVALSVLPLMDRSGSRHTVEDGAHWWVKRMSHARREGSRVEHYLEVRYEDLVVATDCTLRTICDFVGLPWAPEMLRYHEGAQARLEQDNQGEQANPAGPGLGRIASPPAVDRIGRWRSVMTLQDRKRVEAIAGPLLRELGYTA